MQPALNWRGREEGGRGKGAYSSHGGGGKNLKVHSAVGMVAGAGSSMQCSM